MCEPQTAFSPLPPAATTHTSCRKRRHRSSLVMTRSAGPPPWQRALQRWSAVKLTAVPRPADAGSAQTACRTPPAALQPVFVTENLCNSEGYVVGFCSPKQGGIKARSASVTRMWGRYAEGTDRATHVQEYPASAHEQLELHSSCAIACQTDGQPAASPASMRSPAAQRLHHREDEPLPQAASRIGASRRAPCSCKQSYDQRA